MQLVRGRHTINPYHLYIYIILVIKRWNSCVLNSYDCSKFFKHTFNMFSMCFSIGVHPWHELVLLLAPLFHHLGLMDIHWLVVTGTMEFYFP